MLLLGLKFFAVTDELVFPIHIFGERIVFFEEMFVARGAVWAESPVIDDHCYAVRHIFVQPFGEVFGNPDASVAHVSAKDLVVSFFGFKVFEQTVYVDLFVQM